MISLYSIIASIGRYTLKSLLTYNDIFNFIFQSLKRIFKPPLKMSLLVKQMEFIGNRSLGITILAGIMVGAVLALQLGEIFKIFRIETIIGASALYTISKEFAPVVTGFLVAGRAGSAMTAEIGSMKVNEQIDAMIIMAVNPYNYIIAPRIVASVLMMPLLAGIFMISGYVTSFIVGVVFYNVDVGIFFEKTKFIVSSRNIVEGLEKSLVFGLIIAFIACYKGFHATGGAKGVGKATTSSVVISFIAIIIADFILSYIQYYL